MGNATLRKTGNGGIKFKRKFSVSWNSSTITSEVDVIGTDGTVDAAYSFGTQQGFEIESVRFAAAQEGIVTSSLGRSHKIVSGPFFSDPRYNFSAELSNLVLHGAWCPNLPQGEHISLSIKNLKVDNVYEARLVFSSGKKNGSSKILIDGSSLVDIETEPGSVAIARFVATKDEFVTSIKSLDDMPPFINAVVLRNVGFVPSVTATVLLG